MAASKRTKKRFFRRVLDFPQARGKIVERVDLDVTPDYFLVNIRFQDKTTLSFDLEPYLMVYPELSNRKAGKYNPLKHWRPVHSKSPRFF